MPPDTTAPGPATEVAVEVVTDTAIIGRLTPPADPDYAAILVYRSAGATPPRNRQDGLLVDTLTPGNTRWRSAVLPPDSAWSFSFFTADKSRNVNTTSFATIANVRTLPPPPPPCVPAPPTGLTAEALTPSSARVSWSAPAFGGSCTLLRYTVDPGGLAVAANVATAEVTGLPAGDNVALTVTAHYEGQPAQAASVSVQLPAPIPAPRPVGSVDRGYQVVYVHDGTTRDGVNSMQSTATMNDALRPDDRYPETQRPTVDANVEIADDPLAYAGKAIATWTRPADYRTSKGIQRGYANGRWALGPPESRQEPPMRVRFRMRRDPIGAGSKFAIMLWPVDGGWVYEVDLAESFGDHTREDFTAGGKVHHGWTKTLGHFWHGDKNRDGRAIEQLMFYTDVDSVADYHVIDHFIAAHRMWCEVDGVKVAETTEAAFLPQSYPHPRVYFGVGKALSGRRSDPREDDCVLIDWIEISKAA